MAEQTRQERNLKKRQFWISHFESWKDSGLSQVDYCRQKDLSRTQFTYWKCKLSKKTDSATFAPLSGSLNFPRISFSSKAPIRLITGSYEIEIGDGFSPDTLSTLLHTLGRL